MSDPTTWEYWGQHQTWLTRAGKVKHLHGQAFYLHSVVPPYYGRQPYYTDPQPWKNPLPIDDSRCLFWPQFNVAQVGLHYTAAFTSDGYAGLSIFQVNPRSRGRDWEIKHTRLAYSSNVIVVGLPGWSDWPFDLVWPCSTKDELRVFVRLWNYQAFLNFGPMTSQ